VSSRAHTLLTVAATAAAVILAGCLSNSTAAFEPGTGFKETGRTVHLRMWIVDLEQADVAPGLKVNLWAFCAEPAKADDEYSRNAIEYREQSGIVPEESAGKCSVPGPTLRVKQGDKVIVDFENTHVHPHVIHWHGQLVDWLSDGAPGVNQDSVKPGDTFRYEFIAKKAGTLWYHCHVDTQFHVMQGLYGGFIVEPQDDSREPDADKDYLLVLSTLRRELVEYIPPAPGETVDPHAEHKAGGGCGVTGEQGCENPPVDITPDVFLINGKSAPLTEQDPLTLVKVKEGELVRMRLMNAGTTVETIHPHGHDMKVTHRDGSPLESPFWVDTLTIGPAERYDVTFRANNPGVWIMHTHVNDHETNCGSSPGGMETMILYEGFEDRVGTFQAEKPGSCEREPELEIPEDVDETFVATMSATPQEPEPVREFTFNVLGCAVQELRVRLTARASDTALQALNDVQVELLGPDGEQLLFAELGSGTVLQWTESMPGSEVHLGAGSHTLRVSGRALMTTLEARVQANYFEDAEAIEEAGLECEADGHAGH
jgi:FtsP/CotA-like multicopper oxidase with cupredoxin domain